MPTARFFKGYAPAKIPLIGMSLAGPVSADAEALGASRFLSVEIGYETIEGYNQK